MLNLDYDAVHRFESSYKNASWDGWCLVIFKQDPRGATHKRGAYVNGTWGIQTRVSPDSNGKWRVRA